MPEQSCQCTQTLPTYIQIITQRAQWYNGFKVVIQKLLTSHLNITPPQVNERCNVWPKHILEYVLTNYWPQPKFCIVSCTCIRAASLTKTIAQVTKAPIAIQKHTCMLLTINDFICKFNQYKVYTFTRVLGEVSVSIEKQHFLPHLYFRDLLTHRDRVNEPKYQTIFGVMQFLTTKNRDKTQDYYSRYEHHIMKCNFKFNSIIGRIKFLVLSETQ